MRGRAGIRKIPIKRICGRSEPAQNHAINHPLVGSEEIYLLLFHIILWLMKNFIADIVGKTLTYLKIKFPSRSDAKIKEDIFVRLQITELTSD